MHMGEHIDPTPEARMIVLQELRLTHAATMEPRALEQLADAIMPYVLRTRLPWEMAIPTIATHYAHEHERVQHLLKTQGSDAWQSLLAQMQSSVPELPHYLMTQAEPATSAQPIFNYIRERLNEYNFESSLNSWLTVTTISYFWQGRRGLLGGLLDDDDQPHQPSP
jgi:hypothetical protein